MIALSCTSQIGCGGLKLINGDTINLYDSITVQKLKKVFTDLDLAVALNIKYEQNTLDYIEHIEGLNHENNLLLERISNKEDIIGEKEIQVIGLEKINKKLNKRVKALKKMRNLFCGIGLAIGSTLTYLFLN